MADAVLGLTEDKAVVWNGKIPLCPGCNSNLSVAESIVYTERYGASIAPTGAPTTLLQSHIELIAEANCEACGTLLDYAYVEDE